MRAAHPHPRRLRGGRIECGLLPVNQMSMEFYGNVAYHAYEGVALDMDEQQRLVADLGNKPVMMLRNHGLLTTGRSVAEAFLRMYYLEKACEIQLAAQSAGQLILPSTEVCVRTERQFNAPGRGLKQGTDRPGCAALGVGGVVANVGKGGAWLSGLNLCLLIWQLVVQPTAGGRNSHCSATIGFNCAGPFSRNTVML